jgi:CubicO group peptidase (beta-lactamase class C family)
MDFDTVDKLMYAGVDTGVFPGAVLLAAVGDDIRFFEAYGVTNLFLRQAATIETVFDLASLTKPLATTVALMRLESRGRLDTDAAIGSYLRWMASSAAAAATVEQLLRHSAGLPAYRPFYTRLREVDPPERQALLQQLLAGTAPETDAAGPPVYSDLGFMILGYLVEALAGLRLDRFVTKHIYKPLGIDAAGFPRLGFPDPLEIPEVDNVAATEICHWRRRALQGVVHDDNAYAMGGVAGHAGLFGDAAAVFRLARSLLRAWEGDDAGGPFETAVVRRYLRRPDPETRPMGFDAPAAAESSCGKYFSFESVGHLGFTGTSLWMDLARSVIVILLTNRVHPSRSNERIRDFRPRLHDAVMPVLLHDAGG